MFRVSHRAEGIDDADTIEGARRIVRGQPPGRYDVHEIRVPPFLCGLRRNRRVAIGPRPMRHDTGYGPSANGRS